MDLAPLYRPLADGEPIPPGAVRIRRPVPTWNNAEQPKAGYRCPNRECTIAAVLIEVDVTKARQDEHPRTPHLMTDAKCPFCGSRLELGSYFEVVVLVPAQST
jgi:hypothetical protein